MAPIGYRKVEIALIPEEKEVKQPQLIGGLIPASTEPQSFPEKMRREGAGRPGGNLKKKSRELSEKLERLGSDPAMALANLMRYTRPFYPPPCDTAGCAEFATKGAPKRPGLRWCDEHAPDKSPQLPIVKNPNEDRSLYKEAAMALLPYAYSRLNRVEHDMSGVMGNVLIKVIPAGSDQKMLEGDIDGEVVDDEED